MQDKAFYEDARTYGIRPQIIEVYNRCLTSFNQIAIDRNSNYTSREWSNFKANVLTLYALLAPMIDVNSNLGHLRKLDAFVRGVHLKDKVLSRDEALNAFVDLRQYLQDAGITKA